MRYKSEMTHEDIVRMEQEAGFGANQRATLRLKLQRFAALVAAYTLSNIDPSKFMSFQEGMEAGCLAEREACAKVCDDIDTEYEGEDVLATWCAAAIRARGQE